MSDQDRTSPYNIYTVSRKRMMRTGKYLLRDYQLIQLQILGTNVIRIVWTSVRRIADEILGVKGFRDQLLIIA